MPGGLVLPHTLVVCRVCAGLRGSHSTGSLTGYLQCQGTPISKRMKRGRNPNKSMEVNPPSKTPLMAHEDCEVLSRIT
jgi:hypothetical protein